MERLSINPYVVHRLNPANDGLPFLIEDRTVQQIAGHLTLGELLRDGRLFFADHSIQKQYPTNPGRWTAACSAYFYIHPESGDFLPLAIRTNVGADIIYTPLDDENDWLFAKMAFEMNDLFHGQIYHLSNTHDVAEPTYLAALRTLSQKHPVRGFLDRCMCQFSSPYKKNVMTDLYSNVPSLCHSPHRRRIPLQQRRLLRQFLCPNQFWRPSPQR